MAGSATTPIVLTSRPDDWKARAPGPPSTSVTFAAQDKLPKLPVPDLKQTLTRLKESLRPIAWNDAEYSAVEKKIDEFERGKGAELHQRLLGKYAATKHWLEDWWDDGGYLGYRDSVGYIASVSLKAYTELNTGCSQRFLLL